MLTKSPKKNPQKSQKYFCKCCNYETSNKKDFSKHILTAKHKRQQLSTFVNDMYICEFCNRKYKDRSGLWRHKKKCNVTTIEDFVPKKSPDDSSSEKDMILTNIDDTEPELKEMFLKLMNENNDLKNMIVQQNYQHANESKELLNIVKIQQDQHNSQIQELLPRIGNNNTTTNNKVNIQIFLNENCKDAVNINDFLESIQLQLRDLDKMKEIGYVNGITQIFKNGLNKLALTQRPLHCSDIKREILYVKDKDGWEKDENKEKISKAISKVGRKTLQQFPKWMDKHPNCNNRDTEENEEYHALIENTVAQNTDDNKKKIMKNILKEVIIDKDK